MKRLLDRHENALVHHLQRRRNDAGADDFADRVRGIVDRIENAQQRAIALRIAREPDPNFGDDRQRPFAADERADQIEARRVFRRPAELHDPAVGHHRFHAEHVIDRHAIFQRVRPAAVGGDVAADRAGALARRIGSVMKAGAFQRLVEPGIHHARLNDGIAIAEIDFLDRLHPRQHDHHAAADRQAAAGQTRARPARHKRHAMLVRQPHDVGDLLGRARKHDHIGAVLFDHKAVALVDEQIGMSRQHAIESHYFAKFVNQNGQRGGGHASETTQRANRSG